jgi:serine/threonine protein phosphatase PrpC
MQRESVQAGQQDQAGKRHEGVDDTRETRYGLGQVVINFQYRPGLGEDAEPIWTFLSATKGLIGVFDGLGGAGGETVRLPDGAERTGAWLASRIVREAVGHTYHSLMAELPSTADFAAELKCVIQEMLREQTLRTPTGDGRLKSRLIKRLPTTMAISWFDLEKCEFTVLWAGDSRVYSLTPDIGLLQTTTDDLKSNADALENLTDDSPISNCVNADVEFVLHERRFKLQPYSILMAASDGCFGYVRTPLHFEHLLLSTMQNAGSWSDWQQQLETRIKQLTGDDATLSAAAFGWPDFASCKNQYAHRHEVCAQLVRIYDDKHDRAERLRDELDQARQDLAATRRSMWQDYRQSYESLTHGPTRDIPEQGARTKRAGPPPDAPVDDRRRGTADAKRPEGDDHRDRPAKDGEHS